MYHFRRKPFAVSPDPAYLWLGARQKEALAVLGRSLFARQGFALLTGDAGIGKTMLQGALAEGFGQDVLWTVIGDPTLDRLEFFNAIARGFGLDRECTSKVHFLLQFSAFLHKSREEGRKVVLVVEDSHRLRQEMLEELRQLVNLEKAGAQLVRILFIGRREFLDTLRQPSNRAIRQQLGLTVELEPLSCAETGEYIRHRLQVAGMEEDLFTAKAIEEIHRGAGGIPRLINMICEQALLAGAAAESRLIGRSTVEVVLVSLSLAPAVRSKSDTGTAQKPRRLFGGFAGGAPLVRDLFLPATPRGRWALSLLGLILLGTTFLSFYLPHSGREPAPGNARPVARQRAEKGEQSRQFGEAAVGRLNPIGKAIELGMPRPPVLEKKAEPAKTDVGPVAEGAGPEKPDEPSPADGEKTVATAAPQASVEQASPEESHENDTGGHPRGSESNKAETMVKLTATPKKVVESPPKPSAPTSSTPPASIEPARIVLPLRPNSMNPTAEAEKDLHEFVGKLKKHPEAKLLVKGYVSSTTNSPENIKLSEDRAMAVRQLLVENGIEPARITVKGMGNREPLAGNDTREGRAKNRRVEVVIDKGR